MQTNRQLFQNYLAQTSSSPLSLEISSAKGIKLFQPDGKYYYDLISGIAVSNVGHCHPKVVAAVQEQAATYMHLMVYGEYIQAPQVKLAQLIAETLPTSLNNVYLVNSGSEAVEGALKLAKRFTGRTEIISCKNAYHGSTQGALSVMGNEFFKQAFRPLIPDVRQINFFDFEDIELITSKTAAVIIETIQGEAGVRVANCDYFKALRKKCDETGTLLIADEIQCGFGRTGTFWAFNQFDFIPDILVTAKGMGGGMPIGAFIASNEIMKTLTNNPILGHITTFGGHPVSAAASIATIEVINEENLIEEVAIKSKRFIDQLNHPLIKDKRALGLMMAFEFESFDLLQKIIAACIDEGVITDWFLFCDNSMRIAPPLTITIEEIDIIVNKIIKAINSI